MGKLRIGFMALFTGIWWLCMMRSRDGVWIVDELAIGVMVASVALHGFDRLRSYGASNLREGY